MIFFIFTRQLFQSRWPRDVRRGFAAARLLGLWVRIPQGHGWMDGCLSLVSVMCCQVEVSIMGRSLVQRSPTERGVSECDLETSSKGRPRSTRAVKP